RTISVTACPRCRGRTVIYYRRSTARISRCRRTEHRTRRALHRALTALTANRWRGRIYYMNGLTHYTAGVPAGVDRVPALGRTISVTACTSCGRRTVVYYRRSTARVRSCRRTEHRARRALHRALTALTANRWRGRIYYMNG